MMKRLLIFCILYVIGCTTVLAKEPPNLYFIKQNLKQYYHSGAYNKDIHLVTREAMRYMKTRLAHPAFHKKKPAIVLDIDETALSNYADLEKLDFGGTKEQIVQAEALAKDPSISPILTLYRYAKEHKMAVFFITGRREEYRRVTASNLQNAGFDNWDALILREGKYKTVSAAVYKTATRKQLAAQGYDIILNIGDQKSDLIGGYADKTFKLPNPYYFIR